MGWQAAAPQMHLSKRGFGTFRTNEECSWGVVQEDRVRLVITTYLYRMASSLREPCQQCEFLSYRPSVSALGRALESLLSPAEPFPRLQLGHSLWTL